MKTLGKIALGLFVFIGPPVLYEWGFLGDGDAIISLYHFGVIVGGVLGFWYAKSRREEDWSEFRKNYTFKRRKDVDVPLG